MKSSLLLVVFLIVAVSSYFLGVIGAHDAQIDAMNDCVAQKVHDQGYPGDPGSLEAWNLFSASCK